MHIILSWIGGAAVIVVIGFMAGVHWQKNQQQLEHDRQVARLEARIADATKAMQMQRQLAGAYLAKMKELAEAPAPENSNTAFEADAAKRIGAIR